MAAMNGRACGEGMLVSDILKRFSVPLAKLFYPLVLKVFMRVLPPLQLKGGMVFDLFKGKDSPSLIKSYRGVPLSDDDGKAVRRILRTKLSPCAVALSMDT